MFFLFVVCLVGFIIYCKKTKGKAPSMSSTRGGVFTKMSDVRGAFGEQTMQADLERILPDLCGEDFYLHPGPVILNHAPGTAYPTAEVDHLAITPFGVFLFETKHWSGQIMPGQTPAELIRVGPDGVMETRKSPLLQSRAKVAFVQRLITPAWPVRAAGVFVDSNSTLDPALPLDLLSRHDVRQWVRTQRTAFLERGIHPVRIDLVRDAILNASDLSPDAERKHKERVMQTS